MCRIKGGDLLVTYDITLTTTLIFIAHWTIIIGLSIRVIMRRRPVGVSLAWLAVIFSVPFVGALIYLFIGENRIGEKYLKRAAKIHNIYTEWQRDPRLVMGSAAVYSSWKDKIG